MTSQELNNKLNILYNELNKSDDKSNKLILAKAVQLGMTYMEEKIYDGIKIVFSALHEKA